MTERTALIIGAGIGGLASALALKQSGWDVRVLERRPGLSEARSGISVWPNGLRALDVLGLCDAVVADAALIGSGGVRTPAGRWVARTDLIDAVYKRHGRPLVMTQRRALIDLLVEAVGRERVDLGSTVSDVGTWAGKGWVQTGDDYLPADLVVLADGSRSQLRGKVLKGHDPQLRYAGYTTWRFVTDLPAGPVEASETWGPNGRRFAILPLGQHLVYCYATDNAPQGGGSTLSGLEALFRGWHDPIPALLDGLDPDTVIRTDAIEMGDPPTWLHRGRVVLLGDSAHAMTPDLGQGGCQALEDAVSIGALLADDIDLGLVEYSASRGPRGADLVRRSGRIGRIYQRPIWLPKLEVRVTSRLPATVVMRALDPVLDWWPPGPLATA